MRPVTMDGQAATACGRWCAEHNGRRRRPVPRWRCGDFKMDDELYWPQCRSADVWQCSITAPLRHSPV